MKDQLFMPKPGFFDTDKNGPYYCGDSVAVEGLLGFFPSLRESIDVHYIAFARPRKPVVDLLGEENQSMPVLILNGEATADDGDFNVKAAQGRRFIDNPDSIRRYLSTCHHVAPAK